ncbi:hypothetical protein [Geodermatophilus sp. SYSU D00700]
MRLGSAADPLLAAQLRAGHPVLLVARYSDDSGPRAVHRAVQQIYAAARGLRVHHVHVEHLLPAEPTDLEAQVRADLVPLASTGFDERRFDNRFFFCDRQRAGGLLLAVSIGSGRKIDAESLHQPAVLHTAALIRSERPAVLYTSEISRLGRSHTAFGPIPMRLHELQQRFRRAGGAGPWVGDETGNRDDDAGLPLRPYTAEVGTRMMALAARAETEAISIARRNMRGKETATPTRLVQGRAPFGWEFTPPPGFATAVLMDPVTGRRGGNLLYLDTAACRPAAGEVALRLPVVHDAAGQPVDQAALVCWLLAHLGRPGYDFAACADVLVAGGFSTPGLRRARGASAAWPRHDRRGRSLAGKIVQSVLRHLPTYETGVWRVQRCEAAPIRIENMLPAAGRWLTAARAGEIRAYLAELASIRPRPRVYTFSGHPARIGPVPAALWARRRADGEVVYALRTPAARITPGALRAAPLPPIPARDLAASLAHGLAEAADHLTPLIDATAVARADQHAAAEQRLAHRRDALTEANRRRHAQLDAGDPAFEPSSRVRAALRTSLDRDADLIADLTAELHVLQRQAAADAEQARAGVPTEALLDFVASLRDPCAAAFRPALRAALSELVLTRVPPPAPSPAPAAATGTPATAPTGTPATAPAVAWAAQLTLADDTGTWTVPVTGQATAPPPRLTGPIDDRVHRAVAGLRAGRCLPETDGPNWRRVIPGVRAALAVAGPFHLGSVTDPRLLRLGMAVVHPAPGRGRPALAADGEPALTAAPLSTGGLRRLAADTGEPVALLQRLALLYARPGRRTQWLHAQAPTITEVWLAARQRAGRLDRRTVQSMGFDNLWHPRDQLRRSPWAGGWDLTDPEALLLVACPHCGQHDLWPSRLREADGPICHTCRHDRAGVTWPMDPYTRFDQPPP